MNAEDKREMVSLKEHFNSRLDAVEKATQLAAGTLEKRLEGMNEFREALRNQASLFITRQEVELTLAPIKEDLRILRESKAMLEGKASYTAVTVSLIIGITGAIVALASLLLRLV